jgi:hypothetical protein
MEPVLPDAPVEESEFDLDVRLQAVARHISAEKPRPETLSVCGGGECK